MSEVTGALTYVALVVAIASFVVNLLAYRKKTRRRGLYLFGMMVAAWVGGSYGLALSGIVSIETLTGTGVLRSGLILAMLLSTFHAFVDT